MRPGDVRQQCGAVPMPRNGRFSDAAVELVSTRPEEYTSGRIAGIKRTLEAHGIGFSEIRRLDSKLLDGFAGGGGGHRFLVLLDHWRIASDLCSDNGLVPELDYTPLWLLNLTVDGFIEYNPLVKNPDFTDRIDYLTGSKRVACIFGNCQTRPLAELLRQSDEFLNDFHFILMPFVQEAGEEVYANGFDERFLKSLDLLMTMSIDRTNRFSEKVSTEYMRSKLSEKCHVVIIPNLFFTGYFPQLEFKDGQRPLPNLLEPCVAALTDPDSYAEEAVSGNAEIVRPAEGEILENLDRTVDELLTREKGWDVKISDYVLDHYRTHRMFHTRNHPTTDVLKVEAERLLDHLGYRGSILSEEGVMKSDYRNNYIYPEVHEALKLGFPYEEVCVNRRISTETFDEATYLSLLRMFKTTGWWKRSTGWMDRPFNRSIHLSDVSCSQSVEVGSCLLDSTGSAVHLFIDAIVDGIPANTVIATLPQSVAPSRDFITPGVCSDGRIVKLTMHRDGLFELNAAIDERMEMRIDTTWLYRG